MTLGNIEQLFRSAFGTLSDKFIVLGLSVSEARSSDRDGITNPGVYVWWHPTKGVVKVGRALDNSRKRALEHIQANTGGVFTELEKDNNTRLFLFNVRHPDDFYWVASLEIFFEVKLHPNVPSDRLG